MSDWNDSAGADPRRSPAGGGRSGASRSGPYDEVDDDEYDDEFDEHGRPVLYDDGGPRSSRRPLIIGIIALVVVAIAVVVFVSSRDDDEPEAAFSLGAAATNAAQAERVAYELSARLDGRVVTAATGVLETGTESQQVIPTRISGAADDAGALPPGFVIDAIARAVYVDSSVFAAAGLDFERPYVRIGLDDLGDGVELDTAALVARYGGDPLAVIDLLGQTAAQDLGAETIGEEAVQHFRAEVTLEELLTSNPALAAFLHVSLDDDGEASATSGSGGADSASAAPSTTRPTSTGSTITSATVATASGDDEGTVVVDVYVTEDNVVRRLVFTTSVSGAAIGTITFTEFDGDSQVRVPASDQVIDLADAFGP